LLALLLFALLTLSGLLAYEAWSAGRKRRVLADQAMRQYASYAAAKYRDNVQGWLYTALDALFAEAWIHLEDRGATTGAGAAALARASHALEGCQCGLMVRGNYFFEVPLDSGAHTPAFVVPPGTAASPSAAERHWVRDTVLAHARSSIAHREEATWRWGALTTAHSYQTIYGVFDGGMPILIYTFRRGAGGRPISAYGLVTDREHFVGPFFPSVFDSRIVLPPLLIGWEMNDSLLSVAVGDSLGRILFYSRPQYISEFSDTVAMDPPLGHLRIRFTVRRSVEQAILAGGLPTSRVPFLLGALAVTAVLTILIMRQVRAELELARQRANFAASVSHELRTPLAQILLFAETMKHGRAPSEQRRRNAVDVIIRETHRLMTLVDNVLHVTRSERGSTQVTLEWIVLRHVVGETVEELAPLAREAGSEIACEPIDPAFLANADPGAVRQILLNVLDNAVKYGRPGQVIQVGASYANGTVRIWVDDEGTGIPPADRARVWEPFVRLPRPSRPGVTGAGIGLAVVRELVTAQRGRAWVEEGTRGGARFVIALPGALADDDSDAPTTSSAAAVDDD
jgi:signal transduction histidine kinase